MTVRIFFDESVETRPSHASVCIDSAGTCDRCANKGFPARPVGVFDNSGDEYRKITLCANCLSDLAVQLIQTVTGA